MKKLIPALICLFLVIPSQARTITVDDDGPAYFNNIQAAIDSSNDGDIIIVQTGVYEEKINFLGKNIMLTSTNPHNPNVVAATIIEHTYVSGVAIKFRGTEDPNCTLTGFNIKGAIDGFDHHVDPNTGAPAGNHTHATITNCLIRRNHYWLAIIGFCDGTISNCVITDNTSFGPMPVSTINQCHGLIKNCTIANNNPSDAVAVGRGTTTIENCIIYHNSAWWGLWPQITVVSGGTLNISYSCVQGGLDGIYLDGPFATVNWGPGNIDIDPCFVRVGYCDSNRVWVDGDYHLLPDSPCIDAGDNNAVPADATDLDGDGNTTEPIPFDLDGNPRIVDGNDDGNPVVDMGAYELFHAIEVAMKFTPQALNPGSKGKWVKAHFVLPEGFTVEDVDTNSPAKIVEPFYVESEYMNVFVNEEDLVEIEAAFGRAEFCGNGPAEGTINVIGVLTTSQYFCGTDTIKIINNSFEYLAVLASHWLQTDCGSPDWCGGLDVDQDSVVNFVDFAMFDGCCIEFIEE